MRGPLNIAVSAARRAGALIARMVDRVDTLEVQTKGHNDFVTEVDRRAEAEIVRTLRKAFPDHAVLAEEEAADGRWRRQRGPLWIIDPLDGTTNFLHGFPQFAVSIALAVRGRLELGVVYDPLRPELFTALRGAGAQLEGKRIRVSRRPGLEGALIGTGFPFREPARLDCFLRTFREVLPRTAGVRRAGAAALDLAYVAAGRLDGFWEMGLKPWDLAAGILLIEEAGGLVSDFRGRPDPLPSGHIVAGNPRVHKALLELVQATCPEPP
ncbi:MAG: inositol monophosphatase [Gammaproteobacteria bacterium]|nr:MAG: inositol monophosphatase [Gammaproteobacteria bacterium]